MRGAGGDPVPEHHRAGEHDLGQGLTSMGRPRRQVTVGAVGKTHPDSGAHAMRCCGPSFGRRRHTSTSHGDHLGPHRQPRPR